MAFIEVIRRTKPAFGVMFEWQDISDATYYRYTSPYMTVQIRRRATYPSTSCSVDGSKIILGYGEVSDGLAILDQPLQSVPEEQYWGRDFLVVVADCITNTIQVQRDATNTIPVFFHATADSFTLSSEFGRMCHVIGASSLTLDPYTLVNRLLVLPIDDNKTLYNEITYLQERERLIWEPGNTLVRQYPPPGQVVRFQEVRTGDPHQSLAYIQAVLDDYWQRYGTANVCGAELSGGLDSAMICAYYADRGIRMGGYAMMYPGEYRASQHQKLDDFYERFQVSSWRTPLDPRTDFPLSRFADPYTRKAFFHHEEMYYESYMRIVQRAVYDNVTAMFRGIGGDELADTRIFSQAFATGQAAKDALLHHERPPYVGPAFERYVQRAVGAIPALPRPMSLSCPTTITAKQSSSNLLVENGIWPVAPLADPRLYMYFQSLPITFRTNRHVTRAYLQARKAPASIYNARVNEDFRPFFIEAVPYTIAALRDVYRHSVLHRLGIVDLTKLWPYIDGPERPERDTALFRAYCIATAELTLQALGTCVA